MILLDTHALVWLDEGSDRLGRKSLSTINQSLKAGELFVSVISFWEVAMLVNKGRLEIQMDLNLWRRSLLDNGLQEFAMTGNIAMDSALLEDFHGDPADRMIVTTARHLNAKLCTADEKILAWKHELLRFDARV
ncbi:MAG: type II toxin-antitoxin system VapC family toxin [Sedimenticola sp.]